MTISALTDITKDSVLVDTTGAHFRVIEPPVTDRSGCLRFFVSPLNRIGSCPEINVAATLATHQFQNVASSTVDGFKFYTGYGIAAIAAAYKANELDTSNIPFTVEPGLFELEGGGRLMIAGPNILHGKNGGVQVLHLSPTGQFLDAANRPFNPGGTTVTTHGVTTKVTDVPSGALFHAVHEGRQRIFKRRDHGIEPADFEGRVPQGDLKGPFTQLTTVAPTTRFEPGMFIKYGEAHGKILAVADKSVAWVDNNGAILMENIQENSNVPPSSEFFQGSLRYCGLPVVTVPEPEGITWAAPRPKSDIPEPGTIITYSGRRCVVTCLETGSLIRSLRLRTMSKVDINFEEEDAFVMADGDRRMQLLITGDQVYGLEPHIVQGTLNLPGPRVPGALYLMFGGDVVSDVCTPDLPGTARLVSFGHSAMLERPSRFAEESNISRYTVVRMLAAPGEWYLTVNNENGTLGKAKLGKPTESITVDGVKYPVTAKGKQAVLRRLNQTCPRCGAAHSRERGFTVIRADETTHMVCGACASHVDQCPGCRQGFEATSNVFGVCAVCYRKNNFQVVADYSYKPKARLHGVGPLYFGTEVELCGRGAYERTPTAKRAIELSKGLFYAKRDGSIGDGIEFVSHPFSLAWMDENEGTLQTLFQYLSVQMAERDCCGIHIHTSKPGFEVLSSTLPQGEKSTLERRIGRGLLRVQRFIYGNPELTVHFAGRRSTYASLDWGARGTPVSEMVHLATDLDARKSQRYAAVNMTEKTVEFRIFKSTTSYAEYRRNVLFIDSVIQYCRNKALPKNGTIGIASYKKFLTEQGERYKPVLDHLASFNARAAVAGHDF
jgi:ribosomal protein S27AE